MRPTKEQILELFRFTWFSDWKNVRYMYGKSVGHFNKEGVFVLEERSQYLYVRQKAWARDYYELRYPQLHSLFFDGYFAHKMSDKFEREGDVRFIFSGDFSLASSLYPAVVFRDAFKRLFREARKQKQPQTMPCFADYILLELDKYDKQLAKERLQRRVKHIDKTLATTVHLLKTIDRDICDVKTLDKLLEDGCYEYHDYTALLDSPNLQVL